MKRVACFLLVALMLAAGGASAGEKDYAMDLSEGIYEVGTDIPEGLWLIKSTGDWAYIRWGEGIDRTGEARIVDLIDIQQLYSAEYTKSLSEELGQGNVSEIMLPLVDKTYVQFIGDVSLISVTQPIYEGDAQRVILGPGIYRIGEKISGGIWNVACRKERFVYVECMTEPEELSVVKERVKNSPDIWLMDDKTAGILSKTQPVEDYTSDKTMTLQDGNYLVVCLGSAILTK